MARTAVLLFVSIVIVGVVAVVAISVIPDSKSNVKTGKSASAGKHSKSKPEGTSTTTSTSTPSGSSKSTPHKITCKNNNYNRVINFQNQVIASADKVMEETNSPAAFQKAKKAKVKANKRVEAAQKVGTTCKKAKKKGKSPSSNECGGVVYRSYDVKGAKPGAVVRFGEQPVSISGPGDANKVLGVLDKELGEPFKAAVMTQGNYLVDGGISVDQVQATATRFQQNPDQWRDSNRVIRAKLHRAQSVILEQTDMPYNTQDAVLGKNRCVAPAAQNTTSHGKKWILVIHLSQQDGGRTVRLVVNCDFQIQEFVSTAPPATTVPEVHTTRPPATTPPVTAPPPTTPPPVPTTKPGTTTTQPKTPYEVEPPPASP